MSHPIALVLATLIACRPPAADDSGEPLVGDTSPPDSGLDDTGTDTSSPWEHLWDDPAWWEDDNTGHEDVLLDVAGWEGRTPYLVRMWVSDDGEAWEEHPSSPIAHGLSSLGIAVTPVGVAITGSVMWGDLGLPDDRWGVWALTSTDAETWHLRAWWIRSVAVELDGEDTVVDTQFELGDDGEMAAWGYVVEEQGIDPAQIEGPHRICRMEHTGWEALELSDCPFAAEQIIDPSPLMHDGARLLAVARGGQVDIWDLDQPDATEPRSTVAGQVPTLMPWDDDTLRLWTQGNDETGTYPQWRSSDDAGQSWSEPTLPLGQGGRCTSPVGAVFQGRHLMFCAEWTGPEIAPARDPSAA